MPFAIVSTAEALLLSQLKAAWPRAESKERTGCDVVFAVRDLADDGAEGASRELVADRFVVSQRSPVLRTMLSTRWSSRVQDGTTVDLRGDDMIDAESFSFFLEFLYTASCELKKLDGTFFRLIYLASKYDVPSLATLCEEHFVKRAKPEKVAVFLTWCATLKDAASSLRAHCLHLASDFPVTVFDPTTDLSEIPWSTVSDMLDDSIDCDDEFLLFVWAKAWADQAKPEPSEVERVMSRIRYPHIPVAKLVTEVRESGLAPSGLYTAALEAYHLDDAAGTLQHVDSRQFQERRPLWDSIKIGENLEHDKNTRRGKTQRFLADISKLSQWWETHILEVKKVMDIGDSKLDNDAFIKTCNRLACLLEENHLEAKAATKFVVLMVKTVYITDYKWELHSESIKWEKYWRKWDDPDTRGVTGFVAFVRYLEKRRYDVFVANVLEPS